MYVCIMWVCGCMCYSHVEVRGQLSWVSSLFSFHHSPSNSQLEDFLWSLRSPAFCSTDLYLLSHPAGPEEPLKLFPELNWSYLPGVIPSYSLCPAHWAPVLDQGFFSSSQWPFSSLSIFLKSPYGVIFNHYEFCYSITPSLSHLITFSKMPTNHSNNTTQPSWKTVGFACP